MSTPKFFQRTSLFQPPYIEHDVRDARFRFYPISVSVLWKMRTFVEPISTAFRVLTGGKNDSDQLVDQSTDPETGEQRVTSQVSAVAPELAKFREEKIDSAIKAAFESFFADDMRMFVGEMIVDSLREEFNRGQARDLSVVKAVMDGGKIGDEEFPGLDLETMTMMIEGLVKANAKVFGPFAKRAQELLGEKLNLRGLGDIPVPGPEAMSESINSETGDSPTSESTAQNSPELS